MPPLLIPRQSLDCAVPSVRSRPGWHSPGGHSVAIHAAMCFAASTVQSQWQLPCMLQSCCWLAVSQAEALQQLLRCQVVLAAACCDTRVCHGTGQDQPSTAASYIYKKKSWQSTRTDYQGDTKTTCSSGEGAVWWHCNVGLPCSMHTAAIQRLDRILRNCRL